MRTLARLEDLDDLRRRLHRVQPDSAARWGRMSAHQMICHVADVLRMAVGERRVSGASGLLQRTVIKWIALYVPASWPAGIPTVPEVDQECTGTRPADFVADVAAVDALLARVAAQPGGRWPPQHPIFGPLSHSAWLRWAYLHTDHHLRQFGV
jgi:hypothetical protein